MTVDKKQASEFIKQMSAAYPSLEMTAARVKIWVEMMAEIDFDLAMKRLKNHIATSKFAPSIAEILNPEEANKKRSYQEPETVSVAAVMNGGYETFDPTKH